MTIRKHSLGAWVGWVVLLSLSARGQDVAPSSPSTTTILVTPVERPQVAPRNHAQWEKEIAAFEAADRDTPPTKGGILFTGSSTIRLWKSLGNDFAGLPVINRGFGGSEIADATYFAERFIFPHAPKQIILRAGTNDLHNGRLPSEVAADFAQFVATIRTRLPRTEILFIGGNPTPSRWSENDKIQALNHRIREMAVEMPFVAYIDVYDISLDRFSRQARPELFVADRLHFNPDGYRLLAERVRPYLPVPK